MQEYKVLVTWEAIHDVANISDYIERNFTQDTADKFQNNLEKQLNNLKYFPYSLPKTELSYKEYSIYMKLFIPSLIFYIVDEGRKEVHILRILREESNWNHILKKHTKYTYPRKMNH